MPTDVCNDLIQHAHQYEQRRKQQYHAQGDGHTEPWYEAVHDHFEQTLLPEIKRHDGELFVEYWPAWFVLDRERELRPGVATETLYNYEYGTRGTGYICVTNRNVYIVVLKGLTDQFPMTKPSLTGFLLDALSKEIRHLRPFSADRYWTVSPSDIGSLSIASDRNASERIKLVTALGTWEVYEHFFDQRGEIYAALECLRGGGFSSLRPKYHVTRHPRVLSGAELLRSRTGQPAGFSFLPEALDPARAARGLQLLDLHYLASEVAQRGGGDVELDLAHAAAAHPSNPQMQELRRAFAGMRHLLDHCDNADEVLDTLHVRIDRNSQLSDVYRRSVSRLTRPYFKSLHPLPDTPHPALIRTIEIGELHNPDGSTDEQLSYTWGANDNTFISGGSSGIVRIWSLMTGVVQGQFQAFEKRENHYSHKITQLALSPDGKTLLTVSLSQGIKAWNTADWSLRFAIEENREISYCAFDASGAQFAYRPHGVSAITIIDSRTGQPRPHKVSFESVKHQGDTELRSFELAPSGDWALLQIAEQDFLDQRLVAVELATGEELFAFERFDVHAFKISPREDRILVFSGSRQDWRSWDIVAGDWTYDVPGGRFSPSGKYVAAGLSDGRIALHEARSGVELYKLSGHSAVVRRCEFSPDERYLLSMDDRHILKLWDLKEANQPYVAPECFVSAGIGDDARRARSCTICAVNPLDQTVIVANLTHDDAAILDSFSGKVSERHLEPRSEWSPKMSQARLSQIQDLVVKGCAVSADGQRALLVGDEVWTLFDTEQFNPVHSVVADFSHHTNYTNSCSLSADYQWVAVAVGDQLSLWNLTTGQTQKVSAKSTIWSCAFDPKTRWIVWVSGAYSQGQPEFKMLDLRTGAIRSFDNPTVASKWRPSGRPALDEWDVILDCSVSPDGSLVFAAHKWGIISIWDASSLKLVNAWQAHAATGFARGTQMLSKACAAMPDNKTVLTVSSDGAVKLWEIETGKCLSAIHTDGVLEDCGVFPDGKRLVAVGEAGVHWLEIVAD